MGAAHLVPSEEGNNGAYVSTTHNPFNPQYFLNFSQTPIVLACGCLQVE